MKWHQLRMPLAIETQWGGYSIPDAELLGSGSYRLCYALDARTVVKFAWRSDGVESNRHEVEIWQSATAELRKHLADILSWAHDYSWVIMRRAKDVGEVPCRCVPRMLKDAIQDVEFHNSNVGRIGRTVVAVDYGEYAGWHDRSQEQRFGF